MNTKFRLLMALFLVMLTSGCDIVGLSRSTPSPSWHIPVSELFVDESAFPDGWMILHPEDTVTDPAVNHVGRRWGYPGVSGIVTQGIWRASNVEDAEDLYSELRQSQFYVNITPSPDELFIGFEPPTAIDFQSQTADKFYLACGWRIWAHCKVVARYYNNVVYMTLDLEAGYEGHVTQGLTYAEIEIVIVAMDAKFAEFLSALPSATSSP